MDRRALTVAVAVAIATVVVIAVVSARGGDAGKGSDEVGEREAAQHVLSRFEPDEPLGVMHAVAADLAQTGGTAANETAARCADAVGRLDAVGTPDQLAGAALEIRNEDISEAALEQQAGVSSVLAACRGEAPVPVSETAMELAESNRVLDQLLTELPRGEVSR